MRKIICDTLKVIKEAAIAKLCSSFGDVLEVEKITWVVTVPAIWSNFAKQFMRQSCFDAGIISKVESTRLILALEPEAAVASCIYDMNKVIRLSNNAQFLMIDCGGGTVDITAHSIASGGFNDDSSPLSLSELAAPQGGPWGSMRVNENFKSFIALLLGPRLFDSLLQKESALQEVLQNFEEKVKKSHSTKRISKRLNVSSLIEAVFEGT